MKQIIITSLILLILDSIYLSIFKNYYNNLVNKIQKNDIKLNKVSVFLCYCILIFGLNYFIINENKNPEYAFIYGLVIYSVFELTNKAIFNNWEWFAVVIDSIWGGLLHFLTTYLYYKINKIKRSI